MQRCSGLVHGGVGDRHAGKMLGGYLHLILIYIITMSVFEEVILAREPTVVTAIARKAQPKGVADL